MCVCDAIHALRSVRCDACAGSKTTLIKMLKGEEQPDGGERQRRTRSALLADYECARSAECADRRVLSCVRDAGAFE